MSKFLHKIRDAMTSNDSKSKRHSRASSSGVYDGHDGPKSSRYGLMSGAPGNRLGYESYRTDDYGTRFGSYGTKPRPGTYGSGDYSSNTRSDRAGSNNNSSAGDYGPRNDGWNHSPGPMYANNSATNGYGARSDSGVRARRGFDGGGGAAAGSSYNQAAYPNGPLSSYDSRDKMGYIEPPTHVQRAQW
ncbi:hypothetical protein BDV12DRAFT_143078 [Aspergillus spectabilis]